MITQRYYQGHRKRVVGEGVTSPPTFPGEKNFFHVTSERQDFRKMFKCE